MNKLLSLKVKDWQCFLMYPILGSTRIVPSLHKRVAKERGNLSPLKWLWADLPQGPAPGTWVMPVTMGLWKGDMSGAVETGSSAVEGDTWEGIRNHGFNPRLLPSRSGTLSYYSISLSFKFLIWKWGLYFHPGASVWITWDHKCKEQYFCVR